MNLQFGAFSVRISRRLFPSLAVWVVSDWSVNRLIFFLAIFHRISNVFFCFQGTCVYRMPCTKPPSSFSIPMAMDLLGKPHCNNDLVFSLLLKNIWVNFFFQIAVLNFSSVFADFAYPRCQKLRYYTRYSQGCRLGLIYKRIWILPILIRRRK